MSIKKKIKAAFFTTAKWSGMFLVSRFLMRRRLLILGYHGFQYTDEARFRRVLFMDPRRFARRLDKIEHGNYPVLPLAEGVRRLTEGALPANAVVITIDDGFFSVLDLAAPELQRHGFPATLYVTSYYVTKGVPVFRLAVQYLFWKTSRTTFEPLARRWSPTAAVDLRDMGAAHELMWRIIDYGEANYDEDQRQVVCEELADALGLDYEAIQASRGLALLTPDELRRLEPFGIDVQLHTHHHIFPQDDLERARSELQDNRTVLEGILGCRLEHFCYPSGAWAPDHLPMLADEGIVSATTCEAGMNDQATNPLALYRILDHDQLADIEFEAELAGFAELLRVLAGRRKRTDQRHRARA